ncbi:hypothetical protein ACQP1G_17180 [Nocardia sp. CA-107356]|uniref:hypothetical protein n=1 Tax=Nocardia sp. CA-107356 TaxID=3239972 RepID=UPI003D8F0BFC
MIDKPDPTVMDVFKGSPIGQLLDRPVHDVLRDLGLPQLPQLQPFPALPQLPPLPAIDLSALIKPVTDLLAGFGSGTLGDSGFDPTQLLSTMVNTLTSTASLGAEALTTVSAGWKSPAAAKAAVKNVQVQQDSIKVAAQGQQQKVILLDAERVVGEGAAELTGIILKFINEVILGAAFFITPPGLGALIALATETLSEAMVVVARTRGELVVHTVAMTQAGIKIPVTGAPFGVDPLTLASEVLNVVAPLLSPGIQAAGTVVSAGTEIAGQVVSAGTKAVSQLVSSTQGTSQLTEAHANGQSGKTDEKKKSGDTENTGLAGSRTGSLNTGSTGSPSIPISAISGTPPSAAQGARPSFSIPNATSTSESERSRVVQTSASSPSGTMPMAATAGTQRAGDAGITGGDRTHLVTEAHGDEVVGRIEGVSIPVVGAAETITDTPDKELTL